MLHDRAIVAIKECLGSLYESGFPKENIIVCINGGGIPGPDIAPLLEDIRVVVLLDDQGQCKAVNAAVAMTNTPWVMISNDDMVYPPDWFERLVTPMTENMLCVSPQLVEPRDGAPTFIKHFCGGVGGDWDKDCFLKFVEDKFSFYDVADIMPLGLCRTGFNFPVLIKRELWDLVGGYDINYDPWGSNSDSDLQYKIMLAGVQPYQNTNCPVYHFSNTSDTFHPENSKFWHENFAYFEKKWGFKRTDQRIWESDFVIPDEGRTFRPLFEGFYSRKKD